MTAITQGAIIAAGAGSRLRAAGWTVPKPLVQIGGKPLISQVMENFRSAGITSLVIILNEDERDCESWIRSTYPDFKLDIVVKTTASSFESFCQVVARLGPGRALISTVDAWCRPEDFVGFVREAERHPDDVTVLAVTPFVADERPLWVSLDDAGRVRSLGGETGDVVTAGMYMVSDHVRRRAASDGERAARLREFLARLVSEGESLYGVAISTVIDVDRAEDVALAEEFARTGKPMQPSGERR